MFEHNKDRMFLYTSPERKKKRSEKQTKVDAVKGVSVAETENVPETSGGCRSPSKTFNDEDLPGTSGGSSSSSMSRVQNQVEELSLASCAQQNAEMYFLQKENEALHQKLEHLHVSFSFEHIKKNYKLVNMYTGIPNEYLFETLFSLFENINLCYYLGWNVGNISKKDQLLLTLMKLRLNLLHSDLASTFTNCRIVLDCTEVKCVRPT
ncbi:hypothetical protein JTB14_035097 [Gonioctena quinquepunctata]|nr:hypothetical protein JTB14_035097 [Gonioctena quinquepunctata]